MLGRFLCIAPALAVALGLGGCSVFASPPPMPFTSLLSAASLKDAWEPTVVTSVATKVAASAPVKPRPPTSPPRHAAACKTDSDCVVILSALIKDPRRAWIGQPQSAAEYANGTRFFAYRALRRSLTCRELTRASRDLDVATSRLQMPASDVTAAQAASALSLARAVKAELMSEHAGRCKAGASPSQA
jgi:hypothetical protein